MFTGQKEIINELHNATLYSIGSVVVSMISKKAIGEPLGAPENIKGTPKLAAAVEVGVIGVKYMHISIFSKIKIYINKKWQA